jgi:hydroxypyruvate reductase
MPIQEMNVIRKHLSQITGGRLAARAMPASVVSLIISDVIGNAIDSIGSGPTAPDPSTYATALAILDNYNLNSQAPASIIRVLQDGNVGHLPETPKPGDPLFYRVANHIIASNRQAVEAVAQHAQDIGFHTQVLSTSMEGEAREVGQFLASVLREMAQCNRPLPRPGCCIVSGETTVTLKKDHGQGGRNQELALAAALGLTGLDNVALVALATDGIDGPTDAAGAIVDETTVARGRLAGFEAKKHLLENNAYPFLAATGDLLRLGPTGTNVNDLILLLSF